MNTWNDVNITQKLFACKTWTNWRVANVFNSKAYSLGIACSMHRLPLVNGVQFTLSDRAILLLVIRPNKKETT